MKSKSILFAGAGLLVVLLLAAILLFRREGGREIPAGAATPFQQLREHRDKVVKRDGAWSEQAGKQAMALDPAWLKSLDGKDPEARAAGLWQSLKAHSGNPDAESRGIDLLREVVLQWLVTDASRAVAWVQALPQGTARSEILGQVSYEIRTEAALQATGDPKAAAAWLANFPRGEAVESSMAMVAGTWAKQDPSAAVAYATGLPSENARNQAVNAVATAWGKQAPAEASAWVEKLPEGSMRIKAMEGLMTAWTFMGNANEAAQWLQRLPQTRSRDVAVGTFTAAVAQRDPESAFQWAATISDTTLRNTQLAEVSQIWLAQSPAAARSQISQSKLPQEIKKRLLTGSVQ